MSASPLLSYLYLALAEPYGVALATPDLERLRGALHSARRASADPSLDGIILRNSPRNPGAELWIINTVVRESAG